MWLWWRYGIFYCYWLLTVVDVYNGISWHYYSYWYVLFRGVIQYMTVLLILWQYYSIDCIFKWPYSGSNDLVLWPDYYRTYLLFDLMMTDDQYWYYSMTILVFADWWRKTNYTVTFWRYCCGRLFWSSIWLRWADWWLTPDTVWRPDGSWRWPTQLTKWRIINIILLWPINELLCILMY